MTRPLSKYNQAQRDKAIARAKRIANMRDAGKTFAEIGLQLKISPQRVQQILRMK